MRTTVAIGLTIGLLAAPALAQQAPTSPKTSAQKPAAAPPAAQKPVEQGQAKVAPLPEGARVGFCSLTWIAQESKEGKAAYDKVRALQSQRLKVIEDKTKALQANQTLLESATIDEEKRVALQREVARQTTELQRLQQDAQAEVSELVNETQDTLLKRVLPVIAEVAKEKGLHLVVRAEADALLWAEPGLNVSADVVKRLDAGPAAK